MKTVILILLICPLVSFSQKLVPRLENDTLYTTSGFKIYKGQQLHFAKGTGNNGQFRYVKTIGIGNEKRRFTNHTVTVSKVYDFSVSGLGNAYIRIQGEVLFWEGSKSEVRFVLAFDRAITSFPGLAPELTVPDEYKTK